MSSRATLLFLVCLLVSSTLARDVQNDRNQHPHYHNHRSEASPIVIVAEADEGHLLQANSELKGIVGSLVAFLTKTKGWLVRVDAKLNALLSSRDASDATSTLNRSAEPQESGGVTITVTRTVEVTVRKTVTRYSGVSLSQAERTQAPISVSSPPTSGLFNPMARNNIAVYYGQDPLTTVQGLSALCLHPKITIINLAFVTDFFGPGEYPRTAFGPACNLPPNAEVSSKASGLQNCTTLGKQVQTCQNIYGKKIFVSLGGYTASSSFPSSAKAHQFATNLWNLFGGGTASPGLRPLGPAVVDGFDIDNEDHSTAYWMEFATALKSFYTQDKSKRYYLSAAPQCPRPDASIPLGVLRMCDFVFTQFYNNPACNLDSGGFLASLAAWSRDLQMPGKVGPRLLAGLPAWAGAGSGYVSGPSLGQRFPSPAKMKQTVPNFGGIMTWAGAEAVSNVDASGLTFLQRVAAVVKAYG